MYFLGIVQEYKKMCGKKSCSVQKGERRDFKNNSSSVATQMRIRTRI